MKQALNQITFWLIALPILYYSVSYYKAIREALEPVLSELLPIVLVIFVLLLCSFLIYIKGYKSGIRSNENLSFCLSDIMYNTVILLLKYFGVSLVYVLAVILWDVFCGIRLRVSELAVFPLTLIIVTLPTMYNKGRKNAKNQLEERKG